MPVVTYKEFNIKYDVGTYKFYVIYNDDDYNYDYDYMYLTNDLKLKSFIEESEFMV